MRSGWWVEWRAYIDTADFFFVRKQKHTLSWQKNIENGDSVRLGYRSSFCFCRILTFRLTLTFPAPADVVNTVLDNGDDVKPIPPFKR